ncbi:MAG: sensor histidine kinase [Verrucomicrobiaceae bacterium]|nr:sensor histidine kinase [Verrucomicrobiaceae bacterium]
MAAPTAPWEAAMTRILSAILLALVLSVPVDTVAEPLTTALELRSLSAEEAESGVPVDLRGVVIFAEPQGTVFFQDDTAGTYFQLRGLTAPAPGDEIRVRGVSYPGLYLPGIDGGELEVLAHPGLPEAVAVDFDDLMSGRYHYQRVSVEGIVRTVAPDDEGASLVRVDVGSRVVEIRLEEPPQGDKDIIDSRVRVTGLAAGVINNRRQLVEPYLRCRSWNDIAILEAARDLRSIPEISPGEILTFAVGGQERRRVKLTGVVLASFPDGDVYIRSGESGIGARLVRSDPLLKSGDYVEMIGFPEMDRFSARIVDAVTLDHLLGDGPAVPVTTRVSELLEGLHDSDLVSFTAELSEQYRQESGGVLVLRDGARTLHADTPALPEDLLPGTTVRVTGIALVESTRRSAQYRSEPDRVSLRLRSAADIVVLRPASWWTSTRLTTALFLLLAATVLAGLWITLLRRQVARQTDALRERIGIEAALEERHRIAREFHDTLEQDLTGLSLRLDAAVARGSDERLRGFIEGSRNLVSRIQTETRNLIADLRQEPGEEADLTSALGELVAGRNGEPGPEVVMVPPAADVPALPSRTVHHLRMIAQESVTNVIKHAGAATVAISVDYDGEELVMRIADDGRGLEEPENTSARSGRFGCMGMRERCRKIGAEIAWESVAGEGTTVSVTLSFQKKGVSA